jgi:hypothetical protein
VKTPTINRTIKRTAGAIFLATTVAVSVAAVARADGILTAEEKRFGDTVAGALCDYLDQLGVNEDSMYNSVKIIYQHTPNYMDTTDAADIINYAVYNYCPNHWSELVAFGAGARSA